MEIRQQVETSIPLVDEILLDWQTALMADFMGYYNHVYRLLNFCFALQPCTDEQREKLIIAACFHDLGIWPEASVDYLPPSIRLAQAYLQETGRDAWSEEISLIIAMHHKVSAYKDPRYPLVELFRQADLIDVSLGLLRKGLPGSFIAEVKARFGNEGFHRRLCQLAWQEFKRRPLKPLPMMKW